MIPIAALPVAGVLTPAEVAKPTDHHWFVTNGGFVLSTAMEKSGAHRRVALTMVNLFGGTSKTAGLGFMAAAAVLSMWISNTATTLMLLPVALAVIERSRDPKLAIPLLLGIAYARVLGALARLSVRRQT